MDDDAAPLREAEFAPDPLDQFARWYGEASDAGVEMPEAMALASATAEGRPAVRMVLLKRFDATGFVFFTNYESRKAGELSANPYAALLFHWQVLGRQVRIEGVVRRATREETAEYVHSRPRGSQLSAMASPQSRPVESREWLEQRVAELRARYGEEAELPVPENWGGFRVVADSYEFWQHRADRLHDRLRYVRVEGGGGWRIERLAP